jgi:hypothetical protein
MATWNEFVEEAKRRASPATPGGDFDGVRREQLSLLAQHTGRPLIVYMVDFLDPGRIKAPSLAIDHSDKMGFMEAIRRIDGPAVDVLLESPGGSAEATEAIVRLLRQKFEDVRFIVPNVAKSAATMMAMSGNTLVLDAPSEFGPIDPQFIFRRDGGAIASPANAILAQFEWAKEEIKKNPDDLSVWIPILNQYGPSLLVECEAAQALSTRLVGEWLQAYMFKGQPDARKKARKIALYLADYDQHLSHNRPIGMKELTDRGVKILDLRGDSALHERVWAAYYAVHATFLGTRAYKIFENHLGDCLVRMAVILQMQLPLGIPMPGPGPQPPAPQPVAPQTPPSPAQSHTTRI